MQRYLYKLLVLLILVFSLTGCGTKVSVGLTMIPHDSPIEQPLGVVRISNNLSESISVDCEHISSAFTSADIVSLDHCGFYYEF